MNLDAIFKALANPTRRRILERIKELELLDSSATPKPSSATVGEIQRHCKLAQSSASEHLKILAAAGLLTATRVGRAMFYARNVTTLDVLKMHAHREL